MVKKIIRTKTGIYEVKGPAIEGTKFEKGKAYIVADDVYIYWGEITEAEHNNRSFTGFYHCKEVSEHILFNPLGHKSYSVKDIEEVDVSRLIETISLFEKELFKYIEIKNAISDTHEEMFKIHGNRDASQLLAALSAMLHTSMKTKETIAKEVINIQFDPSKLGDLKITRNGKNPKMSYEKHTEKRLGTDLRYQFYEF